MKESKGRRWDSRPTGGIFTAAVCLFGIFLTSDIWAAQTSPVADQVYPPPAETPQMWYAAGRLALDRAKALQTSSGQAKNVILFIGDGMGVSTVTAARILAGQLEGHSGEENLLFFETFPYTCLVKTYNTNQQTPDSAGTMSAIMTGIKTRAGVIGVNQNVQRGDSRHVKENSPRTLLELAEIKGRATGVVTTARLTHATPACCYAHSPERNWEDDRDISQDSEQAHDDGFADIARQLIEFPYGDGLEVAMGGGRRSFLPRRSDPPVLDPEEKEPGERRDGRNLTKEWMEKYPNAAYVWNSDQFQGVDPAKTDHLLGLFETGHMEYEFDRPTDEGGEPSLSEMTKKALQILQKEKFREKGFFLMVEGGRIDHAHHAGNAQRALLETIELANAIKAAAEMTNSQETLILVTADHSHVFTIAGYPTRGNAILGKMREASDDGRNYPFCTDRQGRTYTTLGYANGPGYVGSPRPDLEDVDTCDIDYKQESTVPLGSETHGGEDVAAYATGPGAGLLHGVQEQNYLFFVMAEALGLLDE